MGTIFFCVEFKSRMGLSRHDSKDPSQKLDFCLYLMLFKILNLKNKNRTSIIFFSSSYNISNFEIYQFTNLKIPLNAHTS